MRVTEIIDTWRTRDMGLAAYLSMFVQVDRTEWDGEECFWHFDETDELTDLVMEYLGNEAMVEPREFLGKYQLLNGRLKRDMRGRR